MIGFEVLLVFVFCMFVGVMILRVYEMGFEVDVVMVDMDCDVILVNEDVIYVDL